MTKSFGSVRAVDDVSLAIARGEVTALVGANGSGKSTLLRIVAGVIAPDAGSVSTLGAPPRGRRSAASIGYAGQDLALDAEMTGRETLLLFDALRALPRGNRTARIASAIDEYELGRFCDRPVGGYSGGQRQRLHLAVETLHAPTLLLLDEPTASLDPAGRRALWRRLAVWREAGRTTIVVTHDLAEVATTCDRAIVLRAGRVVADDAPRRLVEAHGRARSVITLAAPPDDPDTLRTELESLGVRGRIAIDGASVTITRGRELDGAEPALGALTQRGIPFVRFERTPADLASAFFELTGASAPSDAEPARTGRGTGGGRGRGAR